MSNRVLLPAKKVGEKVAYNQFDFLSLFASASDSISSISAVTMTVYSGVDPSPQSMVVSSIASGSIVSVLVQLGVLGVVYELSVQVTLASGQTPILCGYLAVVPDLP